MYTTTQTGTQRFSLLKSRPYKRSHGRRVLGLLQSAAFCFMIAAPTAVDLSAASEKKGDWWREPDPEAVSAWKDKRFGMFIHWGPVAISGERISWSRGDPTPFEEYDNLYKQFDAVNFDPDAWVALAQEAGMKYIVLTTKHHDGFCLWDSEYTEYDVMNTPLKRDVVGELAEACHKAGMPFGTYYSVCDWHHPHAATTGIGGSVKRTDNDFEIYKEYLKNQVTELVTKYGPLICMWYDVPQGFSAEEGWDNVQLVRELQPDILVNDRCGGHKGMGLGDFSTPERHVGDFDIERPWESCLPLGRSWSWKPNEVLKPLQECIQSLASTAGGGGNLLLNIGPTPDGIVEPEQVERLREIGAWMDDYGHTIYETRGGPYKTARHLAATRKGNNVFVHILNWPDEVLFLPKLPANIVSHKLLTGGEAIIEEVHDGYIVHIDEANRSDLNTILALELDRSAMEIEPIEIAEVNRPVTEGRPAVGSEVRNIRGNVRRYAASNAVDGDIHKRWSVELDTREAWVEVDLGAEKTFMHGNILEFGNNIEEFELLAKDGDTWKVFYRGTTIGKDCEFSFDPVKARYVRMNILKSSGSPSIAEWQLYGPKETRLTDSQLNQ